MEEALAHMGFRDEVVTQHIETESELSTSRIDFDDSQFNLRGAPVPRSAAIAFLLV
jgi:hypothetical protein